MKKLGTINCGCGDDDCWGRIKLFWDGKHIIARDPHGDENIVEQHYSRTTRDQAIEDIIAMYANQTWELDLI